jgi:crossover junction endodeoxyribonuclease RusA
LTFEFIVPGIPRTAQTKRASSREAWKKLVASQAIACLSDENGYVSESCSATIVYFYVGSTELDVDGIAKLILDGINEIIYEDDRFVEQVLVRKTDQIGLQLTNPPSILAEALLSGQNLVYVRIDSGPNHSELPK